MDYGIPEIDVDDPESIAEWERSPFNAFESKVVVVETAFFHGILGNGRKEPARVAVETAGALKAGIAEEQRRALDEFLAHEEALYWRVRQAVYTYYRENYEGFRDELGGLFGASEADLDAFSPRIRTGHELDGIATFTSICVHPPRGGACKIGIEVFTPWDEEHCVGLLVGGEEIVEVGSADTAMPIIETDSVERLTAMMEEASKDPEKRIRIPAPPGTDVDEANALLRRQGSPYEFYEGVSEGAEAAPPGTRDGAPATLSKAVDSISRAKDLFDRTGELTQIPAPPGCDVNELNRALRQTGLPFEFYDTEAEGS